MVSDGPGVDLSQSVNRGPPKVEPRPRWCPERGCPYLPSNGPDVVYEWVTVTPGLPYETCPCVVCSAGRAREAREASAAAAAEAEAAGSSPRPAP